MQYQINFSLIVSPYLNLNQQFDFQAKLLFPLNLLDYFHNYTPQSLTFNSFLPTASPILSIIIPFSQLKPSDVIVTICIVAGVDESCHSYSLFTVVEVTIISPFN